MLFARIVAIIALAAGSVWAGGYDDDVTTLTSTTTKTLTVTKCNPTKTDCPYNKHYPSGNGTRSYPTGTKPAYTSIKVTTTPTAPLPPATSRPVAAGAGNVFVQTGLLAGVVGLGMAAFL